MFAVLAHKSTSIDNYQKDFTYELLGIFSTYSSASMYIDIIYKEVEFMKRHRTDVSDISIFWEEIKLDDGESGIKKLSKLYKSNQTPPQ